MNNNNIIEIDDENEEEVVQISSTPNKKPVFLKKFLNPQIQKNLPNQKFKNPKINNSTQKSNTNTNSNQGVISPFKNKNNNSTTFALIKKVS